MNKSEILEFLQVKFLKTLKTLEVIEFNKEHFLLFISLTLLAFTIELFSVGWKNSSIKVILKPDKSTKNDYWAWVIDSLNIFSFFGFILTFGIAYFVSGKIGRYVGFDFANLITNEYLNFLVILVFSDFTNYIKHYTLHKNETLWQTHAFHHSSEDLNILSTHRGHFIEGEIAKFFEVLPFVIMGAPITSFFYFKALTFVSNMLLHSKIKSNWGFLGKYIFVSPAAHKIHHSSNPKHYGKNIGILFIFWDRIFGTYYPPEPVTKFGIENSPYNKSNYFNDVWIGTKLFYHSLFKKLNKKS